MLNISEWPESVEEAEAFLRRPKRAKFYEELCLAYYKKHTGKEWKGSYNKK